MRKLDLDLDRINYDMLGDLLSFSHNKVSLGCTNGDMSFQGKRAPYLPNV